MDIVEIDNTRKFPPMYYGFSYSDDKELDRLVSSFSSEFLSNINARLKIRGFLLVNDGKIYQYKTMKLLGLEVVNELD